MPRKKLYDKQSYSFKMNLMKLAKANFKNLMSTDYFDEPHYFYVTGIQ